MRCRFPLPFIIATVVPFLFVSLMGSRLTAATATPTREPSLSPLVSAQQNVSRTRPTGKDTEGFPENLLVATETLFAQGMADPRGGEYRVITVQVGDVWRGETTTVETHGWVLRGDKKGKRFAACWNGLVYAVVAVKGRANLKTDVARQVKKTADAVKKYGIGSGYFLYPAQATAEAVSLSLEHISLMKVVYLLRLGEPDLARTMYAMLDAKTLTQDPYLGLATQWAWAAYDRAICAHMRGADSLALADTEFLTRIQPLVEAETTKRGYTTYPNGTVRVDSNGKIQAIKPLPFLDNLPALRKDSARRLEEKPRPPLDLVALKKLPQPERIAELIRRMDGINERRRGQPGDVGLDAHLVPDALVAEGDAAIEPLFDVMEKDERLTRSVSFHRDFFQSRNLMTVKSAAFACFARITDITEIGEGNPTVPALREWWAKNKGATAAERWFTQLADNGTPIVEPINKPNESQEEYDERNRLERVKGDRERTNRQRWTEAASRIVEQSDIQRRGLWESVPRDEPRKAPPPYKGESLRARKNPSVSDLLRTRALQVSEPTEGRWGFDFAGGAQFALMLYEWDPKGRDTLTTLREVMRRCLDFQNKQEKGSGHYDQYQLSGRIANLTIARLRLDDTDAASEYGGWLLTVSPEYLGFETRNALFALRSQPDHPALRRVAEMLFSEEAGRKTPWNQLLLDPKSRNNYYASELLGSDLIRIPAFRDLVIRRLSNTTEAGVVTKNGFQWKEGTTQSIGPNHDTEESQTLRICDRTALCLQQLGGVPRFDPWASLAERDKQCAAIAAYLIQIRK